MNIVSNLKSKLSIASYLIAGGVIGSLFLKNTQLFLVTLLGVCALALLVHYPVLTILGIMGGTSLIGYHQELPLTKIGSVSIPDLILLLLMIVVIFRTLFLGLSGLKPL
jgi:hypothetical protein